MTNGILSFTLFTMKTEKHLRIYRFHDLVAINTSDETLYLTEDMAKKMLHVLCQCVNDIHDCPKFSESPFMPQDINEGELLELEN